VETDPAGLAEGVFTWAWAVRVVAMARAASHIDFFMVELILGLLVVIKRRQS
jgi:hypothetical protein